MNKNTAIFVLGSVLLVSGLLLGQSDMYPFESEKWVTTGAEISEHAGRKALRGMAYLKEVEFENGVIEVDVFVTGDRSYPGIVFRMQSLSDYERVYLRPHRAGLYPDALQYVPAFNGVAGWQLYNGPGYTAGTEIADNAWVHLKLEVQGKQARLYVGESEQPALIITDLKHGISKGTIGLLGPRDNTAFFSNFTYRSDNSLKFSPAPEIETPPGVMTRWQLSRALNSAYVDLEIPPSRKILADMEWQEVESEPTGLVDIARYVGWRARKSDCVMARSIIQSAKDEVKRYRFGYSDLVSIVLNGRVLFTGSSAYRLRDPSFLGIVGPHDSVYLPLKKGDNELILMVVESFGGWGFMFQYANAVFRHEDLIPLWELPRALKFPESVVYDKKRDVLYVSNYFNGGREFLSKVTLNGQIETLQWVTGLNRPTGMAIAGDILYVVDRVGLVEIDIAGGKILKKHPIPGVRFGNDVAVDAAGCAYISDSQAHKVYKFSSGKVDVWIQGGEIQSPNGLCVDGERLLIGNIGDGSIKIAGLSDKKITTLTRFGSGAVMDGLRKDEKGNYIVSDYNGRVFRVTPTGQKTKLLDTTVPQKFCADLEYIPEKNLLIIPSLFDNRIMAFTLK